MIGQQQDFYRRVSQQIRDGQPQEAAAALRDWLRAQPADEIGKSLLGSALMRCGDTEAALAVFAQASEDHPQSFAAFGDLGFAHFGLGDNAAAIAAFERAVQLNVNFYPGWCHLHSLYFRIDQLDRARTAFAAAERCDPHGAHFAQIQAAMQQQRFAEAERLCMSLLERQPGYPRAAYTLAQLASQVGAFEEASRILTLALSRYPVDVSLRTALVVSYEEAGRYPEAAAEARTIVKIKSDTAAPWLILGRVLGHCGSYEECLNAYERALALAESGLEKGNAQLLRGHVLKILGRHDEAVSAYRSSIEQVPHNGAGWWGLADMKTYRFGDEEMAALRELLSSDGARPEQRSQGAFALGKAHEDSGEYPQAFHWYSEGNALRTNTDFDAQKHWAGIRTIAEVFDERLLARRADPAASGPVPIFIVGLPRSGSTLIEQILASHSQIEGTMELATLPNLVRRITIDGGRNGGRKGGEKRGEKGAPYPQSMALFSEAELAAYGQTYLDDTAIYRSGRRFFIDKLPTNFDKVGLIHQILPQAIVIDARRHPLDCGFSCFKQHFAAGHAFSYSLRNIADYYNAYLYLMDHWDRVLPGKVLCVRYEHLIRDTEAMVSRLLQHCGLPFEEDCLRFFENRRSVRTASSEQVRQPIYQSALAHWKNFETELAPLVEALGESTLARFGD
ncbi:tetratricopeptide repeat-containing sulfotransferase family protein [Microbulbifer magnicolonia]|uniref:tetratricopeptide repeat-containing sulfotransferase family protein n=1 Tax=Microbulbifer magnicolonia TaxID=3109744 RepID=UPI002B40E79D|nr:sulfotransferase [Microbulbifer sp. GG15]